VELARDNDQQFFVTALVGRLALDSGELSCCCAGHPPPLRASSGRVQTVVAATPAIALGVIEEATYAEVRITIGPDDLLLFFTDGVTEAVNARGELFGDARLARYLETSGRADAATVVEGLVTAVNAFAADAAQEDDITVLALRYRGRP
jgi:sigma-B regulation protein RsbU (phosphoserine phosphatase)